MVVLTASMNGGVMFDRLKKQILSKTKKEDDGHKKKSEVAICALLIEMAHFDEDFHKNEKEIILNMIENKFALTVDEADELMKIADEEREKSIDLWAFTKLIRENYSKEERIQLLEMLWKVAYADGQIEGEEDFLLHKLAKMLKIDHNEFIAAKLKTRPE